MTVQEPAKWRRSPISEAVFERHHGSGAGGKVAAMVPIFGGHTYSYMLGKPAERTLERLSELGFSCIEVMAHPGHLWPGELSGAARKDLRRRVEQLGIDRLVLNMPNIDLNIGATNPEMRRYSLGLLEPLVELAGDLGAAGLILGPGKLNPLLPAPREAMLSHFYAALDRLAPIALSVGTELWAENMPFGFIPDAPGLAAALDDYGDPAIGTVYDFANGYFIGEDFETGLAAFRPRLRLVHVSDTGRDSFQHAVLGSGTMPVEPIPGALARAGYDGPIVLEIVSDAPERDLIVSRDRMRALAWPAPVAVA